MWAAVRYQQTKLAVMNDARVEAWSAALGPCSGSESTLGNVEKETSHADGDPLPKQGESADYADLGKTSIATDSGYVSVTRERLVSFPAMIGGQHYTMKSSLYVRCNEPAPPENLEDFFKTAFAVLESRFGF